MRTVQQPSSRKSFPSFNANQAFIFILAVGLIFFISWLVHYAWIIVTTPYPAEYREGTVLLWTDFFLEGKNPFRLADHPLMTNTYGFLYNLVVLPFAMIFGNTLAVHRILSILFIFAACLLIVAILRNLGVPREFAAAGGGIVLASLLYSVIPLARPDGLGEFLFLATILFPWSRKFDIPSLITGTFTGVLAFLAKPYFLLSVAVVSMYVFLFVSKQRALFYVASVAALLILALYTINIFFETYFLDVILNNMGVASLSDAHMKKQLFRFVVIFLPCILILPVILKDRFSQEVYVRRTSNPNLHMLNLIDFDRPLIPASINYFVFIFEFLLLFVVLFLGKHTGAYMYYFFELITPALVLMIFQYDDVLRKHAVITVPLILVNLALLCFWVLYPNKLSMSQHNGWEKLYRYLTGATHPLNSPVAVAEMVRLGMLPVDAGQTEYYFTTKPYAPHPFAPHYEKVELQGKQYLESIREQIQNQDYDYVIVTSPHPELGLTPFLDHPLIDQFYDQIDVIQIAMPQSNQYWTIEVHVPQAK